MKALLLIDIQNDFLPGGPLGVEDGYSVIPVANRLMPRYAEVVATQDWHPPNHHSFASQHPGRKVGDVIESGGRQQVLWPDHCVQGGEGAALAAGLEFEAIDKIIQKGTDPELDSYSGFFDNDHRTATGLESYLRSQGIDAVDIVGLATDYCVLFTALDAVQLGFDTTVILEGVRGIDRTPGDSQRAVERMQEAGVHIARLTDLP
ncbi:bifunctional nicotinamidase/pyrazinamidase [Candidatus Laterigemmans baculatus]|uniref:bifunctional nicotinamidase/pyrazinamidase n=1 Tax=Candidatus Laterigemmans baculatus TaxID=2770505 RepID=UPI0013D951A2|nr:bifunctional nicotinamidase/pyrazinamidase [Candidatus Laterigemmans baculatus]